MKLELDPPHLGNLFVEIHRQENTVQATLWATNSGTKEILESHRAELERILKEDGFQLGQFDVFVNPQMRSFQEQKPDHGNGYRWRHPSGENVAFSSAGSEIGFSDANTTPRRGYQRIDLFI